MPNNTREPDRSRPRRLAAHDDDLCWPPLSENEAEVVDLEGARATGEAPSLREAAAREPAFVRPRTRAAVMTARAPHTAATSVAPAERVAPARGRVMRMARAAITPERGVVAALSLLIVTETLLLGEKTGLPRWPAAIDSRRAPIERALGTTGSGVVKPALLPPDPTPASPPAPAPPEPARHVQRPPAAARGFLSVRTPIDLKIFEGNRIVGSSESRQLSLAPGRHRLVLKNDDAGFEAERQVTVEAGRRSTIDVALPQQRVSVNAAPWAEVWVDGRRVGETPLGTLQLTIGWRKLVLRHPELGERTLPILVRADAPARISVDMRK